MFNFIVFFFDLGARLLTRPNRKDSYHDLAVLQNCKKLRS